MERLYGSTIIFDLDGTLVDTAPDLVRALNEVVQADGLPGVSLGDVRALVGRGARALLRRAYARSATALPEPALDMRVEHFLECYEAGIARLSRPFPGALAMLETLASAGCRLAIATNKPQYLSERLLDALDLSRRFDRIVGADAAPRKKPDASHLHAAAGPDADMANAVMVGDSLVDVAAARAATAAVIVMAHGYSEICVRHLGADRVLEDFADLPHAAAQLLTLETSRRSRAGRDPRSAPSDAGDH